MSEAVDYLTLDEFLAAEQTSEVRHEYVGRRAYAMAGGTERHDLMAQAIFLRLVEGARAAGCRTFVGNRLVQTPSEATYYPDVVVVCGPASDRLHESDASLIVEVLSPSTESIDKREKFEAYSRLPALTAYALVNPVFRRIEMARREGDGSWGWQALGDGDVWFTPYGDIAVADLYAQVDADATT